MRNSFLDLFATSVDGETAPTVDERIEAVLRGVDELAAYKGLRPPWNFNIKLSFPVFLEFWKLNQKLRGESTERQKIQTRRYHSFTVKLPFPLFLKFKELNQDLRDKVPAEDKDLYTMTAWVTLATAQIIIPALQELLLRCNLDPDFSSDVEKNKDKYTMTSWVTASIEKNIIPSIRAAIVRANEAPVADLQAA